MSQGALIGMYCLPVAIPLRGWLLGVSVITGLANVAPCRVLFQFHIPSQLVLPPLTYDHVSCKYRQKKHQCHRPSGSLLALPDCVQSLQHPVRHYMQLFQLPCSFYYGNFFLTEEGRSIIPQKVSSSARSSPMGLHRFSECRTTVHKMYFQISQQ